MTLEQFCEDVKHYQEYESYINALYELNLCNDECILNTNCCFMAELICREFGADYGWFLNWVTDKYLLVKDWTVDNRHGGINLELKDETDFYHFMKDNPSAKEPCWL